MLHLASLADSILEKGAGQPDWKALAQAWQKAGAYLACLGPGMPASREQRIPVQIPFNDPLILEKG
jgi:hypothetical protein